MTSLGNFGQNQLNSNLAQGGIIGGLGNGFNFNNALGLGLGNGAGMISNALNLGYNPYIASNNVNSFPSHDDDNLQSD